MIRVRVTHLKAPWPAGVLVGDVIELDLPAVPQWAVGKCIATDSEPTVLYGQASSDAHHEYVENVVPDSVREADAQAEKEAAEMREHDALMMRAHTVGLKVDRRWSSARLAQEVAKAEKG